MESKKVCVLGAGLSGISHALDRQGRGQEVTIIDRNNEVGGVLKSKKTQGYLLDFGANTLSLRTKQTEDFLKKYKVLEHAIDANLNCSKRFIIRNNKIISLPQGFLSFLTSSFLSPLGKVRLCMEPFIPCRKNISEDESMGAFVERRLGKEALDYAANPFIGGIYASAPESLVLKHAFPALYEMENKHGSIFVGMIKGKKKNEKLSKSRLLSFKEGMQELPKRLAESLIKHPILGFKIKEVKSNQNGQWWVRGESEEGKIFEKLFDEVISTLPAHTLSEINWHGVKQDDLITTLTKATHPPLALTFLGFKRDQISHPLDGFGFLIPEAEKRKVLGTLFSSTLFPNRAPKHHSLLTSFVGGERNPELCNLSDDEIIALSISENSDLLDINGLPNFAKVIRWPKSIPLPDHSMGQRKAAAFKLNSQNKGLFFKGAHIFGAPLPNCLNPE